MTEGQSGPVKKNQDYTLSVGEAWQPELNS